MKVSDLLRLPTGTKIPRGSFQRLVEESKNRLKEYFEGEDWFIGNTPQQGINWIKGKDGHLKAAIVKITGKSYNDQFIKDQEELYYHLKANKGIVNRNESANRALIEQPNYGYPVLVLDGRGGGDWIYLGRYKVIKEDGKGVTLRRMLGLFQAELKNTNDIVNLIKGHLVNDGLFRVDSSDNPLEISNDEMRLALYIRKITSAYFKTRPDVSRVQLHDSQSIKSLENKGIHVLVVGYCPKSESVIIWPPEAVISRFNKRNNVSLYSRFSFQIDACKSTIINSFELSNGDVIRGSHVSGIANTVAFVASQISMNEAPSASTQTNLKKDAHIAKMRDSDALKKIFEDNPQFTFADAVEHLRSNRKVL